MKLSRSQQSAAYTQAYLAQPTVPAFINIPNTAAPRRDFQPR